MMQRLRLQPTPVVAVYSHEWDETTSFFRKVAAASKYKLRTAFPAAPAHTLVQRGTLHLIAAATGDGTETGHFREGWVSPPHIVQGTSARQILPAVASGMPQPLAQPTFQWLRCVRLLSHWRQGLIQPKHLEALGPLLGA